MESHEVQAVCITPASCARGSARDRGQERDLVAVGNRCAPGGPLSVHHERADGGDLPESIAEPGGQGVGTSPAVRPRPAPPSPRELSQSGEQPHPHHPSARLHRG